MSAGRARPSGPSGTGSWVVARTRGRRCAPFDTIDFEQRAWVPESGWPFQRDALDPYLERTAKYLGLAYGNHFSDARFWDLFGSQPAWSEPDPRMLLPFFWQFSRDDAESYPFEYTRFGRKLDEKLGPKRHVDQRRDRRRDRRERDGRQGTGRPSRGGRRRDRQAAGRHVVLCAGGIENARLLLASDHQVRAASATGSTAWVAT